MTQPEFASSQSTDGGAPVYKREAIAEKDGTVTERDNFPGPVTAASVSFWQTCRPYKFYAVSRGVIIQAYSDSCQRRNGTWAGATTWSGRCSGDVANCNGVLRCGRC